VLGIAVAVVARGFPGGSIYDALGPRLLPYIVAGGLVLTGLAILIGAFRSRRAARPEALDLAPVLWIVGALIVPIVLIRTLGWIPVAALVFALGARAFGSRSVLLDLALGLAFGIVTFVLFNYALGLNLPAGSWIR
jgi:putative tricarboxylic transport membrane protein